MIITTEAVILRAIRYGDSSKIVTVFTRDHGRISVIAKGALGNKPRFGAALELMALSAIVYYHKESRDVQTLSHADAINTFRGLQSDGRRLVLGFAVIEYIHAVIHGGEQHRELFMLLVKTLGALDTATRNSVNILMRFLVDFCSELGFSLDTSHCTRCRVDLHDETATGAAMILAVNEGAFACPKCATKIPGTPVSSQIFKGLQWLRDVDFSSLETLTITPAGARETLRILHHYIASHVQDLRTIRSLELLDELS